MTRRLLATLIVLPLLTALPSFADDNWPQFRGPTGQGMSDSTGLPATWDEKTNVVWKTPIHGKAWSSPVVWGNQVWLTTATEDGRRLSAICVDKGSGKVLHDLKLFEVPVPQYAHPFNSYASPTPAVEDGRVYVTFGSPGTACLDARSGKVLWERRDFVCNHWRGAGSSPVIHGDLLFLPFDGADFQYVVALDKKTGETVWKVERSVDFQDLNPATGKPEADGDWRKAFSTPRVVTFGDGGKPVLLSLGSKALYAYEPATGKELWRVENRETHSGSATPVVGKDTAYVNMGHGRSELWAVRPGAGGAGTPKVAWKVRQNVPTRASVLLHDGLIYMVDDGGIASCVEADTGKKVWGKRIGGEYSASPLFADGRVYFFSQDGKSTAIAPGREFKQVGEGKLADGFMASPAVSGKALVLRTKTHLYRVEQK